MSTVSAARWPTEASETDVQTAKHIHGRLTRSDEYALCERDGDLLPLGSTTLCLDEVKAGELLPRPVDCPACLEWMHA